MFKFEPKKVLSDKKFLGIFYHLELSTFLNMISKIHFSHLEIDLIQNTDWIFAKHVITKKVYDMFGAISVELKKETEPLNYLFPKNLQYQSGKISKGENYKLLPYVILDYPAFFWKNRIFAIRTMFWWGNFFSVTLHLSGEYKERFTADKAQMFSFLQQKDFFICVNDNEWQHHYNVDNYIPASSILFKEFEIMLEKSFCKISKKIELSQWTIANKFIINTFREIIQLLQISYQGGKKDLLPEIPKVGSGP